MFSWAGQNLSRMLVWVQHRWDALALDGSPFCCQQQLTHYRVLLTTCSVLSRGW